MIIGPLNRPDDPDPSDPLPNEGQRIVPATSANGRIEGHVFQHSSAIVEGINVRDLATGKLWTVFEAAGGSRRQFVSNPSLSANGGTVAFAQTAEGEDVRVVRIAKTDPLQVETIRTIPAKLGSTRENAREVVVSLAGDGRSVAFEQGTGIVVAEVSTGRQLLIDNARGPSLSRDGRRLAYEGLEGADQRGILVATLDSDGGKVIDTTAIGLGSNPAVSADGRFVAFESDADDLVPGDTNRARDIFVYDVSVARSRARASMPRVTRTSAAFSTLRFRGTEASSRLTISSLSMAPGKGRFS